jgi:hypothetical protein
VGWRNLSYENYSNLSISPNVVNVMRRRKDLDREWSFSTNGKFRNDTKILAGKSGVSESLKGPGNLLNHNVNM